MESNADVILADMGAAQGHRMIPWFRDFYRVMQDSVFAFAGRQLASWTRTLPRPDLFLNGAMSCKISHRPQSPSGWHSFGLAESQARDTSRGLSECIFSSWIRMDARRPDLQKFMRTGCATPGAVGDRKTDIPELKVPDMMLRARTYRFRAFNEFAMARKVMPCEEMKEFEKTWKTHYEKQQLILNAVKRSLYR